MWVLCPELAVRNSHTLVAEPTYFSAYKRFWEQGDWPVFLLLSFFVLGASMSRSDGRLGRIERFFLPYMVMVKYSTLRAADVFRVTKGSAIITQPKRGGRSLAQRLGNIVYNKWGWTSWGHESGSQRGEEGTERATRCCCCAELCTFLQCHKVWNFNRFFLLQQTRLTLRTRHYWYQLPYEMRNVFYTASFLRVFATVQPYTTTTADHLWRESSTARRVLAIEHPSLKCSSKLLLDIEMGMLLWEHVQAE